ncbi:MAG: phage holin family protein [Microbacteriaceae bacterium]
MSRFLVRVIVNAIALWLTTLIVSGVHVLPFSPGGTLEAVLTYLFVALVFGVVNGTLGTLIRIVAFPIYILTLGLVALLVNGLLLMLVAGITQLFGFGLEVDDLGWGIVAAVVLGLISWLLGLLLRPLVRER